MSKGYMPYLETIKRRIEDAFPNSRVYVWAENSIFNRDITIKAAVDNDCACTTVFPGCRYTEEHISALLIALLKERKADNER